MSQERSALDGVAIGVMLLLTSFWGFQQVAVKWIAADVSLMMQAALRSIIATVLVFAWARWRGLALFQRDGTLRAGLVAGLLFAAEFVFIYAGLAHTDAARMSVFAYLAPPLTALGLHFFVKSERLTARQWSGVLLAFAGVVTAFAEGFGAGHGTTWRATCAA
jgi:drug/metabolite transporter (DMT)-like permease